MNPKADPTGTHGVRIGISGFTYPGWRGVFYPDGLPHRRELEYASSRMNTVEINGSFYSLQLPSSYLRWYEETPPDFVFAVKGSRFITHMKKLKDVETALANFLASGLLRMGEKLGPILWQFPPQLRFDHDRFARFLDLLPRDTAEAAVLAERHDDRLNGRSWTEAVSRTRLRHAFEVRHAGFLSPEFVSLLRNHGAALVYADTAGRWPYTEDVTADFVYIRLHGSEQLYTSQYSDSELDDWARKIRAWAAGKEPQGAVRVDPRAATRARPRDVYVYFDNDAKVHAPFDAIRLAERL